MIIWRKLYLQVIVPAYVWRGQKGKYATKNTSAAALAWIWRFETFDHRASGHLDSGDGPGVEVRNSTSCNECEAVWSRVSRVTAFFPGCSRAVSHVHKTKALGSRMCMSVAGVRAGFHCTLLYICYAISYRSGITGTRKTKRRLTVSKNCTA